MMKKYLKSLFVLLALSACASETIYEDAGGRHRASQSFYLTKGDGHYKVGNPYQIFGKWYHPEEDYDYVETGVASWYGEDFHAKDTANGEEYNMNTMTAAHRTLPLPSVVKVTNLENGKTAIFRVNDRGPFAKDRIIDISKKGAEVLDFHKQGTTKVKVEIMADESKAIKNAFLSDGSVDFAPTTPVFKTSSVESNYLQPISRQTSSYNPTDINAKFYVQAGAFNKKEGAEITKQQLAHLNNVEIYPTNIGSGTFYRVRLGPYTNRQEADNILNQVKSTGLSTAKTIQE